MNVDLASIEYLQEQKIHFCMPCYGGMLSEPTFNSFIKWTNTAFQLGMQWTVETLNKESLIPRARNTLVAKFLATPDSTHLMFIDADIAFEPWHILSLISAKKHIIGGLYPMKKLPIDYVINRDADMRKEGNIQEVTKTGTGFMMISREAFSHLDKHESIQPYENDTEPNASYNQYLKNYFDTEIRDGRYMSEDWAFCERWRDLGGRIWIHDQVRLTHVGSYNYS